METKTSKTSKPTHNLHVTIDRTGIVGGSGEPFLNLLCDPFDSRLSTWLTDAFRGEMYTRRSPKDREQPKFPIKRIKRDRAALQWTEQDTQDMLAVFRKGDTFHAWYPKDGYLTSVYFCLLCIQSLDDAPASLGTTRKRVDTKEKSTEAKETVGDKKTETIDLTGAESVSRPMKPVDTAKDMNMVD